MHGRDYLLSLLRVRAPGHPCGGCAEESSRAGAGTPGRFSGHLQGVGGRQGSHRAKVLGLPLGRWDRGSGRVSARALADRV